MNATVIVHWPGQSTPACEKHAKELGQLAVAMGFALVCTPLSPVFDGYGTECANCAKHEGMEETQIEND